MTINGSLNFKFIFISTLLIVSLIGINSKRQETEAELDFQAEIDFRLEKTNSAWRKRGIISFFKKSSGKNSKSFVKVENESLGKEIYEEIKKECDMTNGLYFIRIKTPNNLFFSSAKSCDLVKNSLKDKIIINQIGASSNGIMSFNYDIDLRYSNSTINTAKSKKSPGLAFTTGVEFVENVVATGPQFFDDKDLPKAGPGGAAQPVPEQTFLQKYWWMIMIVVVMMLLKAPGAEGTEEGAPAAS